MIQLDRVEPSPIKTVRAAGHSIEIHDGRVVVDGMARPVSPSGLAALQMLAQAPGSVVTRERLAQTLRSNCSAHAVDTTVLRLRRALGDKRIVATVTKRGYRLAVDEDSGAA